MKYFLYRKRSWILIQILRKIRGIDNELMRLFEIKNVQMDPSYWLEQTPTRALFYLLFFVCQLFCFMDPAKAQVSQIIIQRIELMPNEPSPYSMRDWKQVAIGYDSFVYDIDKLGQYLPLVFTK